MKSPTFVGLPVVLGRIAHHDLCSSLNLELVSLVSLLDEFSLSALLSYFISLVPSEMPSLSCCISAIIFYSVQ